METLHNLQRGEKQINRYTDKYMARSDKFVPVSKLPAPRWNWDYDLTEENTEFLQQAVKDNNQRLMQLQREQSLLNDEEWPVTAWTPGSVFTCLWAHIYLTLVIGGLCRLQFILCAITEPQCNRKQPPPLF